MVKITDSEMKISGSFTIKADKIEMFNNEISLEDGASIVMNGEANLEGNKFTHDLHFDISDDGIVNITKI